jgi:hypothetical protein
MRILAIITGNISTPGITAAATKATVGGMTTELMMTSMAMVTVAITVIIVAAKAMDPIHAAVATIMHSTTAVHLASAIWKICAAV